MYLPLVYYNISVNDIKHYYNRRIFVRNIETFMSIFIEHLEEICIDSITQVPNDTVCKCLE